MGFIRNQWTIHRDSIELHSIHLVAFPPQPGNWTDKPRRHRKSIIDLSSQFQKWIDSKRERSGKWEFRGSAIDRITISSSQNIRATHSDAIQNGRQSRWPFSVRPSCDGGRDIPLSKQNYNFLESGSCSRSEMLQWQSAHLPELLSTNRN
jgi:hypothetical protein